MTHKNENRDPFVASGVENMPSKPENPIETLFSTPTARIGLNIRFMFIIIIEKKQRVLYITRHYKLVYFENEKFLPPFYSIPSFTKLGNAPKRAVKEKK